MRTAIFDLDGTLVDTAPDIVGSLNAALGDCGLPAVPFDAGRKMIGGGARRLVELAVGDANPASSSVEAVYGRFMHHYGQGSVASSTIYPGVLDALRALADRGVAMGVCTNKPHAISLVVLERLGLREFFRSVIGGDLLAERKPAASHIRETILQADGDERKAVMIGDSATDVAAARNAGIPVIVVPYGYTRTPADTLGADVLISGMHELPDVLERIWES